MRSVCINRYDLCTGFNCAVLSNIVHRILPSVFTHIQIRRVSYDFDFDLLSFKLDRFNCFGTFKGCLFRKLENSKFNNIKLRS